MKKILVAFRLLFRFKSYSGINILGLGLSLACIIVISRYLHSELTVDSYATDMSRVFISTMEMENRGGKMICAIGTTPEERAANFKDIRNDPAIELNARFIISEHEQFMVNGHRYSIPTVATDTAFLRILNYPIIRGETTLKRREDAFITEKLAQKLFGNEDPIGLTLEHPATGKKLSIVGILGEVDFKKSIPFELIINHRISNSWSLMPHTLLQLYPNTDYKTLNQNYSAFEGVNDNSRRFQLIPLKKAYLSPLPAIGFHKGSQTSVIVLFVVAIMAMLAGVINFINIYSVILFRRNREFGMRKVFGTSGKEIFFQIFIENAVMVFCALLIGFILATILKPVFENFLELRQVPFFGLDVLVFVGIIVLVPILTTLSPSIYYSRNSPVELLQKNKKGKRNFISRKIYLTVQYIVTLVMVITSLFFVRQYQIYSKADTGFKTDHIIHATFYPPITNLDLYRNEERRIAEQMKMEGYFNIIKHKMNESSLFSFWTFAQDPTRLMGNKVQFKRPDGEKKEVTLFVANPEWMKIFDVRLIHGKMWEESFVEFLENDVYTIMDQDIILSESALKLFEIQDYTQVKLESEDFPSQYLMKEGKPTPLYRPFNIIGVTKDIRGDHISKHSPPVVFINTRNTENYPIMAEVLPGRKTEAIAFLKELHNETFGGEFVYSYIEDDVANIYKEDRKIAIIYSIFTFVAIAISAIGLFS
ncbi:MAG: ABC transporter permease, partial [Rikenellaceae bacterium]|nr:ABC transporter permease [Rikenellaceae bacterium]